MKYPDFNPKLLYYNVECKKKFYNAISDLISSIVHATPLVKNNIEPATPSLGIFSKPSFLCCIYYINNLHRPFKNL